MPCPYPLEIRKDYKKVPKASRGASALSYIIPFLITTQVKRNLSSRSGIGGVLSAT